MFFFFGGIKIGNADGGDLVPMAPVVDTSSDHTMAPASLLEKLRVPELEREHFTLTDGASAEYGIGIARLEIEGRVRPCPVVFGPGHNSLLGASTLAIFNLDYDPASHRLVPTPTLQLGRVGPGGVLPEEPKLLRPTMVAPRDGYRIWLRYSDGAAGEIDLGHLAGEGIFRAWDERKFFESVGFGASGAIAWGDDIELCPDALYMQLTGKSVAEVMSGVRLGNDNG